MLPSVSYENLPGPKCLSPGHLGSLCNSCKFPPNSNHIPPKIQGQEGILGKPPNTPAHSVPSSDSPLATTPLLNTIHSADHTTPDSSTLSISGDQPKLAAVVPNGSKPSPVRDQATITPRADPTFSKACLSTPNPTPVQDHIHNSRLEDLPQ